MSKRTNKRSWEINATRGAILNLVQRGTTYHHHESYLVKKTGNGIVFESAGMKEHDDLEIFEFMYRMDQVK